MNSSFLLFKISITIVIITLNNSILAELSKSINLSETVFNENQTDIHKNYSNFYYSTDIILDDSIELSSQHYVSENDSGYVWRIIVPEENHQILLQFHYIIGFNSSNKNCTKNYIEIRNGLSYKTPLIQRVCDDLPLNIHSIGRELYIKLVNNEANSSLQFSAYINNILDKCHHSFHNCEHHCINTFRGHQCLCDDGFHLDNDGTKCLSNYEEYGSINNKMCKNTHSNKNYKCLWKILAPKNYRIVLSFTHFNLDEEDNDFYNCSRDNHIKIIEKIHNDTAEIEGPYCGTELPEIRLSTSNKMGIEFRTNGNALNSEFVVNYHIVKDECAFNNGGCLHECRKKITSFECFSYKDSDYLNYYE